MKKLALILFLGTTLYSPIIFADVKDSIECVNKKFEVFEESGILVLVNETNRSNEKNEEKELTIENYNISSIAVNAFDNLTITTLQIFAAPEILNLEPESFNGLSNLDNLLILSGIVPMKKNLFREVKSLKSLIMEIDQSQGNIKDVLLDLKNLSSLAIIKSDFKQIAADTFYDTPTSLSFFVLANNSIESIEPNAFVSFKNLSSLIIYNSNGLKTLQPGIFNGLDQLTFISLQLNNLTCIPRNLFDGLKKLEKLELYDDNVEKIESGAFEGLAVKVLDLAINHDVKIEDGAFTNSQIQILKLPDNFNVTVDRAAWGLSNSTALAHIDYMR